MGLDRTGLFLEVLHCKWTRAVKQFSIHIFLSRGLAGSDHRYCGKILVFLSQVRLLGCPFLVLVNWQICSSHLQCCSRVSAEGWGEPSVNLIFCLIVFMVGLIRIKCGEWWMVGDLNCPAAPFSWVLIYRIFYLSEKTISGSIKAGQVKQQRLCTSACPSPSCKNSSRL